MSIVKINAIQAGEGKGEELEARFLSRTGGVDKAEGFEEFLLLRPVEGETRYFVVTRWASEEAFQKWRASDAFQHQHRQTHTDDGRGEAKPHHPVAKAASLLSFEVVARTTRS
jgi:heme-degrading monooxygenase HmoA